MNRKKVRFDVVTIFPKIFDSYLKESLVKRALRGGLIEIKIHNLRDFALGRHKTVDDKAFGGGPGMVIKLEPVHKAVQALKSKFKNRSVAKAIERRRQNSKLRRVILFSTRGKKLDAKTAKRLSQYKNLVLICGRYEGVDERVAKYVADEEISIGGYVLSGGELPALVLIETVSRFLPGFLGKYGSLEDVKGSYPVYTRPEVFKIGRRKLAVPKVLLSGNHKKIGEWRRKG
ncbi:MAG: tRNA (guanosine(37)-N1)-methyltransferase TrmD [Parcubacteria group bacterium]|nr:tRNA (guanosine(37)-N1)-methyltransferase TrmD [Parcubacteria group bacterium]